jgi:hypothetical protein
VVQVPVRVLVPVPVLVLVRFRWFFPADAARFPGPLENFLRSAAHLPALPQGRPSRSKPPAGHSDIFSIAPFSSLDLVKHTPGNIHWTNGRRFLVTPLRCRAR